MALECNSVAFFNFLVLATNIHNQPCKVEKRKTTTFLFHYSKHDQDTIFQKNKDRTKKP